MPLPKRVKKDISLYSDQQLFERRKELLEKITNQDSNLPESVMHEDLDLGMLEYVKENLRFSIDGNPVNFIDRILTIQRWSELSTNWSFTDKDEKMELPFIVVIRKPEVPFGSNPMLQYTIPDRQTFFYRRVPTWNGNRFGADIYKIPQPVPVDMLYDVIIVCNRMRELNSFNKKVMQKFSSRQSYSKVKGHFIPLVLESVNDNSTIDNLEGRRFYQQSYSFQLQGFLIDEEEFEVVPAVDRNLVVLETFGQGGRGTPVKIVKNIISNVEVTTTMFLGDGTTTTFSVGKKIATLFYVDVGGLVQREGIDFFHNTGTSNITFNTPPRLDSQIRVVYTYNENLVNFEGNKISIGKEQFTSDGSTNSFTTSSPIDSILLFEVGGLVQLENDLYTFVSGTNSVTIDEVPPSGTTLSIVYITK